MTAGLDGPPVFSDAATSDIRAAEFTHSRDVDSPVLPDPIGQIPEDEPIGTVTADRAYDTRRCHTATLAREATGIIPIRKNGRPWKDDCPAPRARDEIRRAPVLGDLGQRVIHRVRLTQSHDVGIGLQGV